MSSCKYCKYSFDDYIRLHLLQFKNKETNPIYILLNWILGFIQLIEFFMGNIKASVYELMMKHSQLFDDES